MYPLGCFRVKRATEHMSARETVETMRIVASTFIRFRHMLRSACVCMLTVLALFSAILHAQTPAVGKTAPDFVLSSPTGTPVQLAKSSHRAFTVLIVLRGYPGYQCPFCQKQLHDYIEHAGEFAAKDTNILVVYPGPPAELDQRAKEALAKQAALPSNITLVTARITR
jgi:hypothetical protein